jgi:RNA polymerase sigma factor for flagellar operon FliA
MTENAQPDGRSRPGDDRDRIIISHLPLVKAIAVRVHENLPVHVDLDDLVHAGVLGLMDAVAKFRPEKNVPFSVYAKHRIKGAMLDSLRQSDWASRDMRRAKRVIEEASHRLACTLNRQPTESEIAEELGMDLDRLRRLTSEPRLLGPVSTTRWSGDEDLPSRDIAAEEDQQPDAMFAEVELRTLLLGAIRKLPGRYQAVVTMYYGRGKTMREIGDALGINESRVSQIHKSALDKMASALQAIGVSSAAHLARRPVSAQFPVLRRPA